jgi:hypothetical protein
LRENLILGMQLLQVKNLNSRACCILIKLTLFLNMRHKKTSNFASNRKISVFSQQAIFTSKVMLSQATILVLDMSYMT